jgi:hypothetical protein
MSLRIVQSSGKADLGPVDVPWASCNGTKVKANFSVGVFVTIEIPLCSFADAATLEVTVVGQSVSLDMSIEVTQRGFLL